MTFRGTPRVTRQVTLRATLRAARGAAAGGGRRALRGAPALVLLAGCFSEPPYEPETGLVYTPSAVGAAADGGGTITARGPGPAFALRFADGPGFHFPDSLTLEGAEVLGHEAAPGCFREDQLGVLIAPTARISAGGPAPVTHSALTPVLTGPAVVQMKLEWGTSFACAAARTPGGASTFTVFPDGKIVRIDEIDDPVASPIIAPTLCACEPPSGNDALFHSYTFWTIARAGITKIYAPTPEDPPLAGEVGFGNQEISCAQGAATQVAFAWSEVTNTQIRGGGDVIGFSHELGDVGPAELARIRFSDRSAMLLERGGCEAALDRARSYLDPPKLKIDGVATEPAKPDGIYGGDPGNGGAPGLDLTKDSFELAGPMPGGFAVWVRFPRSVEGIRTTPSFTRPAGEWYLPQRVDERSWIFWFRDALAADQTVTIAAR